MIQNYCMINEVTNTCDNVILWDGNPETWTAPENYLVLAQDTAPTKNWEWDSANQVWIISIQEGQGQIGFTWDGTYLVTNQPQPTNIPSIPGQAQPEASGTQNL